MKFRLLCWLFGCDLGYSKEGMYCRYCFRDKLDTVWRGPFWDRIKRK